MNLNENVISRFGSMKNNHVYDILKKIANNITNAELVALDLCITNYDQQENINNSRSDNVKKIEILFNNIGVTDDNIEEILDLFDIEQHRYTFKDIVKAIDVICIIDNNQGKNGKKCKECLNNITKYNKRLLQLQT